MNPRIVTMAALIALALVAAPAVVPAADVLSPTKDASAKPCVIGSYSYCVIQDHCIDPPDRWYCY